MTTEEALRLITEERDRAVAQHKPFQNRREAHSVIEEEYDEFWDEIKCDNYTKAKKEVIQLGAMVLRYLTELE